MTARDSMGNKIQPGDRVTVRYNKPLGVLTVRSVELMEDGCGNWFVECTAERLAFAGPATSLKKVENNDG